MRPRAAGRYEMRMSPITLAHGPKRLPKPSDTGQNWGAGQRLHFVGIGGCGLSGLARLLAQRGAVCTGSDILPSDLTEDLLADGIHEKSKRGLSSIPNTQTSSVSSQLATSPTTA